MSTRRRWNSGTANPAPLAEKIQFSFSGKTSLNRFLKSATSERLSSWSPADKCSRGIPSKSMINLYRIWGQGGAGIIVTGNIMIDCDNLEVPGNAVITRNCSFYGERFERFRQISIEAKKHGSLVLGQLNHPGRQVPGKIQQNPVSASSIQTNGSFLGANFNQPHAASISEISDIIEGFVHAAIYLHKAGFDGVEVQAAHGFLLSQFLSKKTNKREDSYGGPFENRARLLVEIVRGIRERVPPSFILSVKINSTDFQDDLFGSEEVQQLRVLFESNRIDFVELSGGTYEAPRFVYRNESSEKREAFFAEFADLFNPTLKETKVYITGGMRSVGGMLRILSVADGVGLGRPLCAEPRLCADILSGGVSGAILDKMDPLEFGTTALAAAAQIKQISRGRDPIDLTQKENVTYLLAQLKHWYEGMLADTDGTQYELMDLDGAPVAGSFST